ncbi:calcium-binding protein [Tropicibacter sp. S64]|uniref:calcium-binding protein n=1 Tax=Tropicibacter sp. S64 TaxID=3415122 RepID=UPI003C7C0B52
MLGLLPFAAVSVSGGDSDDDDETSPDETGPDTEETNDPTLQGLFLGVEETDLTAADPADLADTAEPDVPISEDDGLQPETPGEDTTSTGSDTITGTTGNDTLTGTANSETIFAGPGDDIVEAGEGSDGVDGGTGSDTLNGGIGNDTILGSEGADNIVGGDGSDFLLGGDGDDSIDGGADDDSILGGAGSDTINGGLGDDVLDGGSQSGDDGTGDVLDGQTGDDTLYLGEGDFGTGGSGADSFHVDGIAQITDFDTAQDMLVVEYTGGVAPTVTSQSVSSSGLVVSFSNGTVVLLAGLNAPVDASLISFLDVTPAT